MDAARRQTLEDLMREEGMAELIGGRIVSHPPDGWRTALVRGEVLLAIGDYAEATGRGIPGGGTLVYGVPELSSGRESFSPSAAYYTGPLPDDRMSYIRGAPDFAAEVRGCFGNDPNDEAAIAAKRADYFEAGTLVVWDVDPAAGTIRSYRRGEAEPALFGPGTEADAEPAVPGWRVAVDRLFA